MNVAELSKLARVPFQMHRDICNTFKEDMESPCLSPEYQVGTGFLKVSKRVWKGLANIFTWKDENSEQKRSQEC